MSKRAEQAALKAYPEETRFIRDYNQLAKRQIYQQGYEHAEKDLALTWEDVNLIDSILIDMQDEGVERYGGLRQYYEETLKRFNEMKNE